MSKFYRFAKVICGPLYRIMFRFKVKGLANIPSAGGVILCANHTNLQDTVVLGVACPRQLHFLAKHELWQIKYLSWLFDALGAIPINRESPTMDSFKRTLQALKEGRAIAIFMQGGRRQDFDQTEAKAGVALFAVKGRVPVVPVNISSKFKIFSKVRINIGAPISFEDYWGKKVRTHQLNEIAGEVMDAIAALQ
ncbi:MAG: 1-acyl-sn-glycerol-3-phosphate acyltransferase [Clostridiales bacterium]|jgi:1-acyl-sn-glycerol-3-phosphate acyltransferase|nr:1-acyl-sn-glycerol-3-phosphate acyltransferase [Clostridiales bacterium]